MPNEQNSSVTPKNGNNGSKLTARKIWGFYYEGRDLSSKFRKEADRDCQYYDNEQWTEEEKQELDDRGQPATVFNRIKPTIDLILGTEAKARVDFHAAPRKNAGITDAQIATESLKYVMDQNEGEYLISSAFESEIKAGWQWIELSKNDDPFKEIVKASLVPRDELIWDPLAKEFNKSDGKYMIRPKWLELEDGVAKFPRKREVLEMAVSTEEIEPFNEQPYHSTEAEADRPGVASWRDAPVSITEWVDKTRKRVKLLECWYKVPQEVWLIDNEETGDVEEFDPKKLTQVLLTPGAKLIKKWLRKVRLCIVAGNEIIQDGPSPHRHNEYPFVPFWAYLKDKDGSPYGLIRQLRDPQDEINKRRSKALHLMNSRQVIATSDVIDQKQNDWKEVAEAINDPEGIIKLDSQKFSQGGKFEIISPAAIIEVQSKFMEEAKREIEEAGVNRELQGLQSNAQSGRAIIARQIQGNTMLGKPFDNYRRSRQLLGQLTWAMIQQYWTKPKSIRVTDKLGNYSFIDVNQRVDIDGKVFIRNDITRAKVDIVIDEQAFNATIRQSLADQMFELITKLPPEVSLLLLDEVVDFIDLPNKERMMQKIQMAQGVMQNKMQQEQQNQAMLAQAGMARAQVGQSQLNTRPEERAMAEGLR
jgi:hypothetical protein